MFLFPPSPEAGTFKGKPSIVMFDSFTYWSVFEMDLQFFISGVHNFLPFTSTAY